MASVTINNASNYFINDGCSAIDVAPNGDVFVAVRNTSTTELEVWRSQDHGSTWSLRGSHALDATAVAAAMRMDDAGLVHVFFWKNDFTHISNKGLFHIQFDDSTATFSTEKQGFTQGSVGDVSDPVVGCALNHDKTAFHICFADIVSARGTPVQQAKYIRMTISGRVFSSSVAFGNNDSRVMGILTERKDTTHAPLITTSDLNLVGIETAFRLYVHRGNTSTPISFTNKSLGAHTAGVNTPLRAPIVETNRGDFYIANVGGGQDLITFKHTFGDAFGTWSSIQTIDSSVNYISCSALARVAGVGMSDKILIANTQASKLFSDFLQYPGESWHEINPDRPGGFQQVHMAWSNYGFAPSWLVHCLGVNSNEDLVYFNFNLNQGG